MQKTKKIYYKTTISDDGHNDDDYDDKNDECEWERARALNGSLTEKHETNSFSRSFHSARLDRSQVCIFVAWNSNEYSVFPHFQKWFNFIFIFRLTYWILRYFINIIFTIILFSGWFCRSIVWWLNIYILIFCLLWHFLNQFIIDYWPRSFPIATTKNKKKTIRIKKKVLCSSSIVRYF